MQHKTSPRFLLLCLALLAGLNPLWAQFPNNPCNIGPTQRVALINMMKGSVVEAENSRAGQIALTDTCGNQYYQPYTEIQLTPIGYTPTATGNTDNISEFVITPAGDVWYIDWQGNGLQISAGACDQDWLRISDNDCPAALTDSIYKYKYAAIGARQVWPQAELLVCDSTDKGMALISGFRNTRLGLYDNLSQYWSVLDQGGSETRLIIPEDGQFYISDAVGQPQNYSLGNDHFIVTPAASEIQIPDYPNSRIDATDALNFLYTDEFGVIQTKLLSSVIPAALDGGQGINVASDLINAGASDSLTNTVTSRRHFNLPTDAAQLRINSARSSATPLGDPAVLQIVNQVGGTNPYGAAIEFIEKNSGSLLGGPSRVMGTSEGLYILGNQILSLNAAEEIVFPNYPDTRDDGTPEALFGPDAAGNLRVFPISAIGGDSTTVYDLVPINPLPTQYQPSGNWARKRFDTDTPVPSRGNYISNGLDWLWLGFQLDTQTVRNIYLDDGVGGIYKGSGTIPGTTNADITGSGVFNIRYSNANPGFTIDNLNTLTSILSRDNTAFFQASNDDGARMQSPAGNLVFDPTTGAVFTGVSGTAGMRYAADYSANYTARSLVDKDYVDDAVASAGDGIYGHSGTIFPACVATLTPTESFSINYTTGGG